MNSFEDLILPHWSRHVQCKNAYKDNIPHVVTRYQSDSLVALLNPSNLIQEIHRDLYDELRCEEALINDYIDTENNVNVIGEHCSKLLGMELIVIVNVGREKNCKARRYECQSCKK